MGFVYRLPIRDGNSISGTLNLACFTVFRLPIRDGNQDEDALLVAQVIVFRLPIRDGNDTALYPLRGDGTVYRLPIRDRAPPRIGLTTSAIMYRLFLEDKIRSFRRHFMMPVIQS